MKLVEIMQSLPTLTVKMAQSQLCIVLQKNTKCKNVVSFLTKRQLNNHGLSTAPYSVTPSGILESYTYGSQYKIKVSVCIK